MTVAEWPSTALSVSSTWTATVTVNTWSQDAIIEHHDNYWTVHDPVTGIFGTGEDSASALEDFRQALHEHLDVLSRQEALSPELAAQLTYLQHRLA